jgi:hypothetical protein
MGKAEQRLSTFMVICIVGFLLGCCFVLLWVSPIAIILLGKGRDVLLVLGITLMGLTLTATIVVFLAFYTAHKTAQEKARHGPRKTFPAKIHARWVTNRGKVVDSAEEGLEKPRYYATLITEANQRLEVEMPPEIFARAPEGAWGYAECQGDWMGNFTPDPALYAKHTRR